MLYYFLVKQICYLYVDLNFEFYVLFYLYYGCSLQEVQIHTITIYTKITYTLRIHCHANKFLSYSWTTITYFLTLFIGRFVNLSKPFSSILSSSLFNSYNFHDCKEHANSFPIGTQNAVLTGYMECRWFFFSVHLWPDRCSHFLSIPKKVTQHRFYWKYYMPYEKLPGWLICFGYLREPFW